MLIFIVGATRGDQNVMRLPMAKTKIIHTVPSDLQKDAKPVDEIVIEFAESCQPLETSSLFGMMEPERVLDIVNAICVPVR
jgi:hypothetical protein